MLVGLLFWLGAASSLVMCFAIGSNDICQSLVVGSNALSVRTALIVGAAAEFLGVVLLGSTVAAAFRNNFVDMLAYDGQFAFLSLGMFAALLAAAFCLFLASFAKLPVSTTHAGVGGLLGFALYTKGIGVFKIASLANVALSWVVSPAAGGVMSYAIFYLVNATVLAHPDSDRRAAELMPYYSGGTYALMALFAAYKVLPNAGLVLSFQAACLLAAAIGIAVVYALQSRGTGPNRHGRGSHADSELGAPRTVKSNGSHLSAAEDAFIPLLIATAVLVSFAHGSNDIGNGVGCFLVMREIAATGRLAAVDAGVPLWILVMGGVGIAAGIVLLGHRVIATMGSKITVLTPSRGFSAQLGVSAVVLLATGVGVPVSLSHTMVGAITGLTLVPSAGSGSINTDTIKRILVSWVVTVPIAAVAAAAAFAFLRPALYSPAEEARL